MIFVHSNLGARIQPLKLSVVFPCQALSYGDPLETTTAPRHHGDDALVRAHGAVTPSGAW